MAKQVLGPNSSITVNGTDLSDHALSVTVDDAAEEVDSTGWSMDYREFQVGLKDASISATFAQDMASSSVDQVLSTMYYNNTAGTVKVNPDTSGTVVYTLVSKLYSFPPINGGVGDLNSIDVTFRNNSSAGLTRGTA